MFQNGAPRQQKAANVEPTLRQAAMMSERNGAYAEAAQHYGALHSRHPEDQTISLALARNLRFAGNPQQSIAVLNSGAGAQASDALTLLELGKDYLAADQLNLAKPTLERAKGAAPLNWEILSTLGVVYDYEGSYDKAQEQYEAALFLAPENPIILNNKALSLAQEGELDEALKVMQVAIDQPQASAQTRQNMALLMALKGDSDAAERLARKDLPASVAEANVQYYRSLAKPTTEAPKAETPAAKTAPAAKLEHKSSDDMIIPPPPPAD